MILGNFGVGGVHDESKRHIAVGSTTCHRPGLGTAGKSRVLVCRRLMLAACPQAQYRSFGSPTAICPPTSRVLGSHREQIAVGLAFCGRRRRPKLLSDSRRRFVRLRPPASPGGRRPFASRVRLRRTQKALWTSRTASAAWRGTTFLGEVASRSNRQPRGQGRSAVGGRKGSRAFDRLGSHLPMPNYRLVCLRAKSRYQGDDK